MLSGENNSNHYYHNREITIIICHSAFRNENNLNVVFGIAIRNQEIKNQLLALGDFRPGSLTRQYNVCGKVGCRCKDPDHPQRHGPYYQLSYVWAGKSTSRFVRPALRAEVKKQLATYKQFRRLTDRWITLAITKAELLLKESR